MALLIKAAALFAALTVAPAVAPAPTKPPIDAVARAKAPKEAGEVVDIVASVNAYVNTHIEGESDLEHYGIEDLWVMYPADGKGDCEDYQLTKLGMLGQAGVPLISETKLVSVLIIDKRGTEGHEILAVRFPHGTVLYLDNLNRELMTREELVKQHYHFFDWKA